MIDTRIASGQRVRTSRASTHGILRDLGAHRLEVHARKPPRAHTRDRAFDLRRRHALERALDQHPLAPAGRAQRAAASRPARRRPHPAPIAARRHSSARTAPARDRSRDGVRAASGVHRHASRPPRREARLEDAPARARRNRCRAARGRLRHQRVAGHAGRGVDLEQPRPAGAVAHEVDAAPAAATGGMKAPSARLPSSCSASPARPGADVLRVLGDVLGVVVVVLARRHDADRRQRLGRRARRPCTPRPAISCSTSIAAVDSARRAPTAARQVGVLEAAASRRRSSLRRRA